MITPIPSNYLSLVEPDARKKALRAYNELLEISQVLESDEEKFFDLVDKGYPHNEYEEQEIEEFYFRDPIEAQLQRNSFEFLKKVEEKCNQSPQFMERLAPYALFDDEKWWTFTSHYFSTTNNYDVALGYLSRIYEYMQYRGDVDIIIIHIILNKNENFFDNAFDLHKKYLGNKCDFERLLGITGKNYYRSFWPSANTDPIEPAPIFSFNSWKKYFIYCDYDGKIEKTMQIQGYTESEAINNIFGDLVRCYEDRPEIIEFLLEDYEHMTGMKNFDFLPIELALHSLKEEEKMYKNNKHLKRENYSDKAIIEAINNASGKMDASILLDKLKELNVDEKYYQSLLLKMNLDNELVENNTKIKIKKI